jgi:hypothetical protein
MLPRDEDLLYCVTLNGHVCFGVGAAIGKDADDAWYAFMGSAEPVDVENAKAQGFKLKRCAVMVINAHV